MKVAQLRDVLNSAATLQRDAGNAAAALGLQRLATLCSGHETKTVAAFTTLLAKAVGDDGGR